MRKLLTFLLVVLALVVGFVGSGTSTNRPWTPDDLNNGGTVDDHPWGGDESGGSGGTTSGPSLRPRYYATTGYWAIDYFFSRFVHSHYFQKHVTLKGWTVDDTSTTTRETTGNVPNPNSAE